MTCLFYFADKLWIWNISINKTENYIIYYY